MKSTMYAEFQPPETNCSVDPSAFIKVEFYSESKTKRVLYWLTNVPLTFKAIYSTQYEVHMTDNFENTFQDLQ